MRYRGQSFEVDVVLPRSALAAADRGAIAAAFHAAHERLYGHADPAAPIQVIALRMVVSGTVPEPHLPQQPRESGSPASLRMVDIWLDGTRHAAPLYARSALRHGHRFAGPAIVLQDDCTTCVPPGMHGTVDRFGNLRLTLA
jgi:N-methylhydantoinase A